MINVLRDYDRLGSHCFSTRKWILPENCYSTLCVYWPDTFQHYLLPNNLKCVWNFKHVRKSKRGRSKCGRIPCRFSQACKRFDIMVVELANQSCFEFMIQTSLLRVTQFTKRGGGLGNFLDWMIFLSSKAEKVSVYDVWLPCVDAATIASEIDAHRWAPKTTYEMQE